MECLTLKFILTNALIFKANLQEQKHTILLILALKAVWFLQIRLNLQSVLNFINFEINFVHYSSNWVNFIHSKLKRRQKADIEIIWFCM